MTAPRVPVMADATPTSRRAAQRRATGARAESLVCEHLERQGFDILARNVRVGRLEIDVIARRRDLLVFCEVRARSSAERVFPSQTVEGQKGHRVRRAVAEWLRRNRPGAIQVRIDVASIVFDTPEGRLTYLEGAL